MEIAVRFPAKWLFELREMRIATKFREIRDYENLVQKVFGLQFAEDEIERFGEELAVLQGILRGVGI
jgi:hypothetical protein